MMQDTTVIKKFSIKDLERLSGIKAHTLRIWERRYRLLQPRRTLSNIRFYTTEEVNKLLYITLLAKNGYRVSQLATLPATEIERKIHLLAGNEKKEAAIIALIGYMYTMDIESFEAVLDSCLLTWDTDIFVNEIVYPFLQKTEILWQGRQLDEEHFVVTIIRKKLIIAIENLPKKTQRFGSVLLFLSDQSQLDLALLCTHYRLKCAGVPVIYVGNDVSAANLKTYLQATSPDFLYTYLPQKNRFAFSEISCLLSRFAPGAKLFVTLHSGALRQAPSYPQIQITDHEAAIDFLTAAHQKPALVFA